MNESILEKIGENLTEVKYLVNPAIARDKELKELVMVLLTPEKSAVLVGKPGIGKTAIVEGLAYRIQLNDVPNALMGYQLYRINTPSLLGDYDGENRVVSLVNELKTKEKIIIFIDEIDAIALHRSFQSLRGDVAEIVNSLLTEMDGINDNKAVVTIGATNNPNSIDYAVRSRFEEEIEFVLPDDNERKSIFENNLKTFPLKYDLNIEKLVKISKNMSGRDIKEKILKTALHHAISHDKETVDNKDVEYALKASKIKNSEVKGMFE